MHSPWQVTDDYYLKGDQEPPGFCLGEVRNPLGSGVRWNRRTQQ